MSESATLEPVPTISFDEITGGQPTPVQAPPAQPVDQPNNDTPAPQPSPAKPEESINLQSLFGPPSEKPADPPAPNADEKPDASVPALLRAELSKKNNELKQLEAKWKGELAEKERLLQEQADQFDTFRRELSVTDPSLSPEVATASDNLNRQIDKIVKTLPPTQAREFTKNAKPLIDEYSNLGGINDAGYDDRHEALRSKLVKQYGQYADDVMRNLPNLEERANEIKQAVSNASSMSSDVLADRARKTHKESLTQFEDALTRTLTHSDELAKADPFASRNVISALIDGSPEFKETSERLVNFLKMGMVPPQPLSPEAESGMTPDQKKLAVHQQAEAYQRASQEIFQNAPIAYHALASLPIVTKAYHDLKKQYDALLGSSPSESRQSGPENQQPTPQANDNPNGLKPITLAEISGA